ncbi:MAG: ATP-dependent DNA ligase, partial [Bacteroidota bacterium]
MEQFAALFQQLDQTTKTNTKVAALANYFDAADDQDKLWTVAILSHRRPKRTVNTTLLRTWAAEMSEMPQWLFEESYHVVGDLAETIARMLPPPNGTSSNSLSNWIDFIKDLGNYEEPDKRERVRWAWDQLNYDERFIFNKLITGGFRIGVSQKLMVRALSKSTGIEENTLAHRLMGNWTPDDTTFHDLVISENALDDLSKPYPFYLAYALEEEPETLGSPEEWIAERKWDGIRGQVIIRSEQLFVWSRGEELVTDKFPEYTPLAKIFPSGTVIDGEVLPFKEGKPLSFQHLQTRIGRKNVTKKVMENAPVILMAYDLLEWEGQDLRETPISERREKLVQLLNDYPTGGIVTLSEQVQYTDWEQLREIREDSRAHYSEGIMLKRNSSTYRSGRKRGDWWKWKVDPLTIDAVMIYAQRGHGRRANLYTDYTFAVWNGSELVPFTKAYSGLTDKEFLEVTAFVRKNTIDRFGPVRSVKAELVFEIAFEGIQASTRHKSGVALRFPRIKRWRKDKPREEANTPDDLKAL